MSIWFCLICECGGCSSTAVVGNESRLPVCVVPEVPPLFLAGYTRGWDDREARPGDFDVDVAWAAHKREVMP